MCHYVRLLAFNALARCGAVDTRLQKFQDLAAQINSLEQQLKSLSDNICAKAQVKQKQYSPTIHQLRIKHTY